MKRILCTTLALLLTLILCASASAADNATVEDIVASGKISEGIVTTLDSIRDLLSSKPCVFLIQEGEAKAPFVNIAVEYKGEIDTDFAVEVLRAIAQSCETYSEIWSIPSSRHDG